LQLIPACVALSFAIFARYWSKIVIFHTPPAGVITVGAIGSNSTAAAVPLLSETNTKRNSEQNARKIASGPLGKEIGEYPSQKSQNPNWSAPASPPFSCLQHSPRNMQAALRWLLCHTNFISVAPPLSEIYKITIFRPISRSISVIYFAAKL